MRAALPALATTALGIAIAVEFARMVPRGTPPELAPGKPMLGDPEVLREKYEVWKQENDRTGGDGALAMGLHWSKGLSAEHTSASGRARFDAASGAVSVEVWGLEDERPMSVWLVDNQPGPDASVQPEPTDHTIELGTLARGEGVLSLEARVESSAYREFAVDLVVVAPAGEDPGTAGLLFGTPTLFQRLYWRERAAADRASRGSGPRLALASFVPPPAVEPPVGPVDDLASLVAKGETLFFNERFKGNGRTCGTCHPAGDNLTIDAEFIDDLPNDDALFVAEFLDALNFDKNGGLRFENPVLMRKFGLIAENVDGFGNLAKRFAMRGVPHVFAQSVSIRRPQGSIAPPNDRTGWSGDGAPSGKVGNLETFGTLRDFPVGAVRQHFTKTLARAIGVDFRLPTDDELDAMEAFMLSLGRQKDLQLDESVPGALVLADVEAEAGKDLFRFSACNGCHGNAGANVIGTDQNFNFNTGIELFLKNHPDSTGEPRPVDGGFGTAPDGTFPPIPVPNPDGSFGDRTFNTPGIVEVADTLPAFHNNVIGDLEEAIRFYQSPEFFQSQGFIIPFNDKEVTQVAKFLRVINSLDNLDNSVVKSCKRAIELLGPVIGPVVDVHKLVNQQLRLAIADLEDTVDVLREGDLHAESVDKLLEARGLLQEAMAPGKPAHRIELIGAALDAIGKARALMVVP